MKRNYILLLFAAALLLTSVQPILAAITLPTMTEKTLDNGLKIIVVENREQPVASMRLLIKSGTAADGKGKAGLADLTAGLLRKGTATRDATKISEEIDFVGGNRRWSWTRCDKRYIRSAHQAF